MRYKLFGRSGLRVSELCLGAMTFGKDWNWGADAVESRAMFDAFASAGGNFIDTAHVYTNGTSEKLVGEFIAGDRDHFVVATKYTPSTAGDLVKAGNSRKNMMRCVDESLERLGTDHIDLYWLHLWDSTTPLDEVMRGFDDLVAAGKVLYVAVSDTPAWQISRANMLADLRGWAPLIGIQVEYSLAERTPERELLPMAKELDLGITAWSPLAGGVLTGKYASAATAGTGRAKVMKDISARKLAIAAKVVEIARAIGHTPSQVALAAIRQQQRFGQIIPILGASSLQQMQDNLGCVEVVLSSEHLRVLHEVSAIQLGFPHDLLVSEMATSFAVGGDTRVLDNHRKR
jgi:aryl-alcohol dehydrogenase-like predicted oxidoreductase